MAPFPGGLTEAVNAEFGEDGVMASTGGRQGGVIFEFVSIGAYVKVSAIDVASNTEISIVGNPAIGEVALKRTALRKLEYVLAKKQQQGPGRR